MKNTICILLAFFCMLTLPVTAQEYVGIAFGVTVSTTTGGSQYLVMGVREGCTKNIDPTYQEFELPPVPPAEVFDARMSSTPGSSSLGTGSTRDYRALPTTDNPFTETYTIAYQAGLNASNVTVTWQDLQSRIISGTIEGQDIASSTEYTTQFNQGTVTIVLTMTNKPMTFKVTPSPVVLHATPQETQPYAEVSIICENDKNTPWEVLTDTEWLSVSPGNGIGDDTIMVSLGDPFIADGNYNGEFTVRARIQDISVTIPVILDVSVGVDDVPAAAEIILGQNFPNPFGSALGFKTTIPLQLHGAAGAVTLKIHDVYGRCVADLTNLVTGTTGAQQIEFDASGLPAGIYWYKLSIGDVTQSRTMLLVK
jgi:hypothetical protein